jgi:hypothetical protein
LDPTNDCRYLSELHTMDDISANPVEIIDPIDEDAFIERHFF